MNAERSRTEPYLHIGEVAERTGVTQRTLRFYEERGLLKPPTRLEGGFRLYSEDDISRVEQIRRMQNLLGLSLADIKELVEAEEVKEELRATFRPDLEIDERIKRTQKRLEVTQRQFDIINSKLTALLEMKQDLDVKLSKYRETLADLDKRRTEVNAGLT